MKAQRFEARKTQDWVADQLDMSQAYYSRIETGDRPADLAILIRFARLFGSTVAEMFPMYTPTDEEAEIIRHARESLDPRQPAAA